jgi:hypothetical protein
VFASTSIADRIEVRALNTPEAWGPSDHCQVVIDVRQQGAEVRDRS